MGKQILRIQSGAQLADRRSKMRIISPKLVRKGRWSKDEKKRARRRKQLEAAAAYMKAVQRESGFQRSTGAASKAKVIDRTSHEFVEIESRYVKGSS